LHQIGDQGIGIVHSIPRIVHELRLDLLPAHDDGLQFVRLEQMGRLLVRAGIVRIGGIADAAVVGAGRVTLLLRRRATLAAVSRTGCTSRIGRPA